MLLKFLVIIFVAQKWIAVSPNAMAGICHIRLACIIKIAGFCQYKQQTLISTFGGTHYFLNEKIQPSGFSDHSAAALQ
jgi:hypothetical protein